MPDVKCKECSQMRRHRARGMCGPCYDRVRHAGRLPNVRPRRTFEQWFTLVDQGANGCWPWPGPVNAQGYGTYGARGHSVHRRVYELIIGPIPAGLHLDHICRNTRCIRPDHLDPVPPAVNVLRGVGSFAINSRKVVCKRGHSLTDPTNVRITKAGHRSCITCNKIRCAEWYRSRSRSERQGSSSS